MGLHARAEVFTTAAYTRTLSGFCNTPRLAADALCWFVDGNAISAHCCSSPVDEASLRFPGVVVHFEKDNDAIVAAVDHLVCEG